MARTIRLQKTWIVDENDRLGPVGGFGVVFAGESDDGRPVAIKLLFDGVDDPAHRELQFAKSMIGTKVQHLIPILDAGIDPATKQSCIVMERADRSLAAFLASEGKQTEDAAAGMMIEIAQGLLEAGDWIHRDLKPGNVLRFQDRWCVTDFGIGRSAVAETSTRTLKDALSPPYAAPEQFVGRTASHSTDVYALGCIGATLIQGKPPFDGPRFEDFSEQHQKAVPALAVANARLRSLLMRMLAKPQQVRPTIEKIIAEMEAFRRQPDGSGAGASALIQASSVAAEAEAREQARKAQAEERKRIREELQVHAFSLLGDLLERFLSEVRAHAPGTQITDNRRMKRQIEMRLLRGVLRMSFGTMKSVSPDGIVKCGWDIVSAEAIAVEQGPLRRGASLFFASVDGSPYRWWEIAFWKMGGEVSNMPFELEPKDAARALAGGGSWDAAYPPRPIESEDEIDAFCQRWMTTFANAAESKLQPPSHFPEQS
ncbi:MAG: serine/threonine protein kinase [Rhodospirillaceae bacterium]|nr:serine/threonine protein kinase [Rhodospirillaceae bacterium]